MIVDEVRTLVERGTREVVLLSQIVERYGRDLRPRLLLSDLLRQLDDQVPGLERIRFLTSYPGDFGRDLVDAIADLPKVCEDVNLPIQSGDDEVLRRMKRGYVVEHYRQLIGRLRAAHAGDRPVDGHHRRLPGRDARPSSSNTLRMLDEFRFDVVHVAMYSPRPGTVAATEMLDDVPREEKRRRLHEVEALQKRIATGINARYLGPHRRRAGRGGAEGPLVRSHADQQAGPLCQRRAPGRRAGRRDDHWHRAVVSRRRAQRRAGIGQRRQVSQRQSSPLARS